MSELPSLDSVKRCQKCGTYTSYGALGYPDGAEIKWVGIDGTTVGDMARGVRTIHDDWLIRTCRRCGYQWKERCADA